MALTFPHSDPIEIVRRLASELRGGAGDLYAILDLLPFGIGIAADAECRDIRVNRAFAAMLGIDAAQNASLTAPEAERPRFKLLKDGRELGPEDLPMQYAARHGVEVRAFEVDVVHPDGRRVSLFEYAAPVRDEQGRISGAIGVFVDITERRRIEQQQRFLADASHVLSSSLDYEQTLRALARLAVPFLGDYCAVDLNREDGTFERVDFLVHDPAHQHLAEILKRYPPVLTIDSPATRAVRNGRPEVANECPPDVLARSAQTQEHLHALERLGVTAYMFVPLRVRSRTLGLLTCGSLTGRHYSEQDVAFAMEVGGRAALALENALLYEQAQEANRLKDEFLANLSHELRTPLNALLGWAHLLKEPNVTEETRRRALEGLERNARAQLVLISDLLDVSRVVSGKLRLEQQSVDVAAVVHGALDAIRPTARARDLSLEVSIAPVQGMVRGDPDRLQQVVWNLLGNAVKFTPAGGCVSLSVSDLAGAVQIIVADNGPGIDPVLLPFVFERFRQGDSSSTRTQSGLGLGLAIVRNLVDLHGGTVTAESEGLGRGARFVVTLPTHAAADAATSVHRQ